MAKYMEEVKRSLEGFSQGKITHILRSENTNVDALAKQATSEDADLLKMMPVEIVSELSIDRNPTVLEINREPS